MTLVRKKYLVYLTTEDMKERGKGREPLLFFSFPLLTPVSTPAPPTIAPAQLEGRRDALLAAADRMDDMNVELSTVRGKLLEQADMNAHHGARLKGCDLLHMASHQRKVSEDRMRHWRPPAEWASNTLTAKETDPSRLAAPPKYHNLSPRVTPIRMFTE